MIKIAILGATGSVGSQTLELIQEEKNKYEIEFIAINSNFTKLQKLTKNLNVKNIYVENAEYKKLKDIFPNSNIIKTKTEAFKLISKLELNVALNAISGFNGLDWTIHLIKNNIDIALANKESLVIAGELINKMLKKSQSKIIPVDSEHNAIYQVLQADNPKDINKIILTCSGGPFRDYSFEDMKNITVENSLKQPNWSMGSKITIDSATLFNKALEIIEARWLFNTTNIEVVIHYESIIHSLVEFKDKTTLAQLSYPSMKQPILYAINNKKRIEKQKWKSLDLAEIGSLNFKKINHTQFPAINLAYECLKKGGSYPVVLNAANEYLVSLFLNNKINYFDIYKYVKIAIQDHKYEINLSLDKIKQIHHNTIEFLKTKLKNNN